MDELLAFQTARIFKLRRRILHHYEAERLHKLRVRVRRLCSQLKQRDDQESADWLQLWREFAKLSNSARDWDVLTEDAQFLLPRHHWKVLRPVIEAEAREARKPVLKALKGREWKRDQAAWRDYVYRQVPLNGKPTRGKAPEVETALARATQAMRRALQRERERDWHNFRIAIKELRYTVDAATPKGKRDSTRYHHLHQLCVRLQDDIGRWHDGVVQDRRVKKLLGRKKLRTNRQIQSALQAFDMEICNYREESLRSVRRTLATQQLLG